MLGEKMETCLCLDGCAETLERKNFEVFEMFADAGK